MIEFRKGRVFCNFLFSDSKLFIDIFLLAVKCGSSNVHNKLISTRSFLITVVSSIIFRYTFLPVGRNSDDGYVNIPYDKFFWSMVLIEIPQRKLYEPSLLSRLLSPIDT